MAEINTGDMIRISAAFTNVAGAAADPTTVTLRIRTNGVETVLTGGSIIKDSVGNYHYDYVIPTDSDVQEVTYRWEGAGAVTAVEEGFFYAVSRY